MWTYNDLHDNTVFRLNIDDWRILQLGEKVKDGDYWFSPGIMGFTPINSYHIGRHIGYGSCVVIRERIYEVKSTEMSEHEKMIDFFFKKSYHSGLR